MHAPLTISATLPALGYYGKAVREQSDTRLRIAELDATVPARDVPEHEHHDGHLVFVLAGAYVSTACGMPEVAPPLTAVANPPGTTHRDRFLALPGRYLVIGVERNLWYSTPRRPNARERPQRMAAEGIGLLLRIHRQLHAGRRRGETELEEAALELCAIATGAVAASRAAPAWLERVRERFHAEALAPPTLHEAACEAGVHPTSLSRAFRRHYGLTISDWIRFGRIERAADLLRRERISLADAALATGFSDQAHLTRSMRRTMGVTPGMLRRLSRAADA